MADIDDILERLITDAAFRQQLARDPAAALSGYELSADDIELLANQLDDPDDAERLVETRTSKSALMGLLASLTGGGGGTPRDGQVESFTWSATEGASGQGTPAPGGVPLGELIRGGATDPQDGVEIGALKAGGAEAAASPHETTLEDLDLPVTDDAAAGQEVIKKLPGPLKYGDITLKRGSMDVDPGDLAAGPEDVDAAQSKTNPYGDPIGNYNFKIEVGGVSNESEGAPGSLGYDQTGSPDEQATGGKGTIDVESWSWGETNAGSFAPDEPDLADLPDEQPDGDITLKKGSIDSGDA